MTIIYAQVGPAHGKWWWAIQKPTIGYHACGTEHGDESFRLVTFELKNIKVGSVVGTTGVDTGANDGDLNEGVAGVSSDDGADSAFGSSTTGSIYWRNCGTSSPSDKKGGR